MLPDEAQRLNSNWVTVDLAAIQDNLRYVLAQTSTPVMAIVKANAYGHGALPVARAALEAGATWLGVARPGEALDLRQAGLKCPILLLGYTPPARVETMIAHNISMTVWDAQQVARISEIATRVGQQAHIHLKVDTGMSRLGVHIGAAVDLARRVARSPNIDFEGLFTHFARADEVDVRPTDQQEEQFREVLQALTAQSIRPPLVHASNSAASLSRPSARFDLLRFGIALYGLHPSPTCPLPKQFRPALTWKTVLSQVKTLPPGRGLSYGHAYTTRGQEKIGTVPVGYADGFRRLDGNRVLVGGEFVPVVGRVCMDQIMVQLDSVPDAQVGDEVVLIGQQGSQTLSAEDIAERWGTINYEVVCAIGARVPRFYL